jgi:hypothetical protein
MLAAIASVLLAAAAATPQVDVGRFEAETYPRARMAQRDLPYAEFVGVVERVLRDGQCSFGAQTYQRFDVRVPYLVQLNSDGTANRVVISDIGCEPIEVLAGRVVLELDRLRDFQPTGRPAPGWFRSELRFTLE